MQVVAFAVAGVLVVASAVVLSWRAPTWVQWWHRAGWVAIGGLLLAAPMATPTPYGTRLAPYARRFADYADLVALVLVALAGVCLVGAAVSHHRHAGRQRRDAVEAGEPVRAARLAPATTSGLVALAGMATSAGLVVLTSGFDSRMPAPVMDRADRVAASGAGRDVASAVDVVPGRVVVVLVMLVVLTATVAVASAAVQRVRRRRADLRYSEHMDYFDERIELEQARVMGQVHDALQTVSMRS
ncbi:MAG: hypothetical protein ACRCXL_00855 [Dermatophilaceae bacterium]